MVEKVVLAYSGGLDTSCILKWLVDKGYEVICVLADVGQKEDFEAAKDKAYKIGASQVIVKDIKNDFVVNYIWPAVQMGIIYEQRYLLGTSLARPCITVALIEAAKQYGAQYLAHGATGKGNDQVRFELSAMALHPKIKIIAPWRNEEFCQRFQGRSDLIEYAKLNNIPVSAKPTAPWSTDANILHVSYESGVLEDPYHIAPDTLYTMTVNPIQKSIKSPVRLSIHFEHGLPIKVVNKASGKSYEMPLEILEYLNEVGGAFGIGRVDIVENRFVGLKSRGVYETPGGTILYAAHQDLEVFCLDREVLRMKQLICDRLADYVYNGFWFSPEAEYARDCLKLSQLRVSGEVIIELLPGRAWAVARQSNHSNALYNAELVSMDVHGGYESQDATGFITVNGVRIKEHVRAFGNFKLN